MAANLVPAASPEGALLTDTDEGAAMAAPVSTGGAAGGVFRAEAGASLAAYPGQLGGVVLDPSGAAIPGAQVAVTSSVTGFAESTVTDASGRWMVTNFPAGRARIRTDATGFNSMVEDINYDPGRGAQYPMTLGVGAARETIQVNAGAVSGETEDSAVPGRNYAQLQQLEANRKKQEQNVVSANVVNLQRRVAGVLPVAIEVPRTGTSFQFVRPLVLDEETKVTFSYKSR
jgi:Carboxypeptidase regulatory-like domain